MLLRYWPRDAVVVRDMAPLVRADVLLAATARGVPDPEGFVAGLEKRSLVPVAALPVTLKVLLDRAAERASPSGELPRRLTGWRASSCAKSLSRGGSARRDSACRN